MKATEQAEALDLSHGPSRLPEPVARPQPQLGELSPSGLEWSP